MAPAMSKKAIENDALFISPSHGGVVENNNATASFFHRPLNPILLSKGLVLNASRAFLMI